MAQGLVHRISMLLVLAALAGCASSTRSLWADYDPEAASKFPSYKSYAWLPPPEGGDPRVVNELTDARIVKSVDEALSERGYRKVGAGEPADFLVGYKATIEGRVQSSPRGSYGVGFGSGGTSIGIGFGSGGTHTYEEGTLIIEFADGESTELVWQGAAQGALDPDPDMSPEKRQRTIDKAVRAILKQFPPEK